MQSCVKNQNESDTGPKTTTSDYNFVLEQYQLLCVFHMVASIKCH